ncbi:VIT1/CCC1 transporter family protein [Legionella spiritensis]|uniref:Integral membrane protein n=1 Tax=Legionella spiritensis TaxID=452 RepID=A0A0W0Z5Z5_LEGSP|nr:VIT1/CCC1 transporter family protein [Legionella spiritensis]KTD64564.1 integral membrane protein [Legionella spiritensis]SNV29721.1 integral membrane protein [Legionella spiritensis]
MVDLEHSHTEDAIAKRFSRPPSQSYLRDWIYGGIDGAVTTFAIVSGVVGGKLSSLVILILGFANLLADGFSMAASNYLGTKSEIDQFRHYEAIEEKHIETIPEGERNEIRQIFRNKGVKQADLEKIVQVITENKSLWIKTMLQEEYGLPGAIRSPFKSSLCTFLSFLLFGMIPLIPYILGFSNAFGISCLCTGAAFFIIGSIKGRWSARAWYFSGFETLVTGVATAALAYYIGAFLNWYLVG